MHNKERGFESVDWKRTLKYLHEFLKKWQIAQLDKSPLAYQGKSFTRSQPVVSVKVLLKHKIDQYTF